MKKESEPIVDFLFLAVFLHFLGMNASRTLPPFPEPDRAAVVKISYFWYHSNERYWE